MSLIKAQEARDKRGVAYEEMLKISKEHDGVLPTEARARYEKFDKEQRDYLKLALRLENEAKLAGEQAEQRQVIVDGGGSGVKFEADKGKAKEEYLKRFMSVVGAARNRDLNDSDIDYLRRNEAAALKELRGTSTQVTTTTTLGGFLIPEAYSNELEIHRKVFGGMLMAGRTISTNGGAPLPWPSIDDTSNVGAIIAEGVADTVADLTFSSKSLGAYTYTSKVIKIGWELLQDGAFDFNAMVSEIAGERLGRIENLHLTSGDGSGKPAGFLTDAGSGLTAGSATAVTGAELISLLHSVDPAYRNGTKSMFMFNDATLAALKSLTIGASDARPLWKPGLTVGAPDTIDGKQYVINQDMPAMASGLKAIAFGDFSKYIIRQVRGTELVVLRERYADERVNGFFAYQRLDGKLINTDAIKYITMA